MIKLAIVGDLSMHDPHDLQRALDAALAAADHVIMVGDMHPAYDIVKARLATGKLSVIPGNHDADWDAQLGIPKQWRLDNSEARMVGLDNSQDHFDQAAWDLLKGVEGNGLPVLVFAHKPISTIVLPDGTESNHIMGEGIRSADAIKLQQWFEAHNDAMLISGHYHDWTLMKTPWGDSLIEGRGGAAGPVNCGYTLMILRGAGMTLHKITL